MPIPTSPPSQLPYPLIGHPRPDDPLLPTLSDQQRYLSVFLAALTGHAAEPGTAGPRDIVASARATANVAYTEITAFFARQDA